MTRINTNVSSLTAQKILGRSNDQLEQALTRLSTGLRINSGKDDPAGLIASETLRSDITSTQQAITNSQTADQMIATADSALGQAASLLNDIRGLVTQAANTGAMSADQIAANQLQVDSSLEALNRISQTTSFQGRKILDGSLNFITDSWTGKDTVTDYQINQANLGATGSMTVTVAISQGALQATTDLAVDDTDGLADDVVLELSGDKGSQVFNFAAGTSKADVAAAINLVSDATGVEATAGTDKVTLTSTDYGKKAFVDVSIISQGDDGTLTDAREVGTDMAATVNGTAADTDGNTLKINTATLSMEATVLDGDDTGFNFDITDGGAVFQLGPSVVSNQQARIGIGSLNSGSLGGKDGRLYELGSGQDAALATDPTKAASIVDEAITKLSALRGRFGAFQKTTLETNMNSLTDTMQNLTAAESSIRDADFAAETANLTRAQILVQSGSAVLSIANKNPENVLALLK